MPTKGGFFGTLVPADNPPGRCRLERLAPLDIGRERLHLWVGMGGTQIFWAFIPRAQSPEDLQLPVRPWPSCDSLVFSGPLGLRRGQPFVWVVCLPVSRYCQASVTFYGSGVQEWSLQQGPRPELLASKCILWSRTWLACPLCRVPCCVWAPG